MAGTLNPHVLLSIKDLFNKRCIKLFIDAYNLSILNNSFTNNLDENDISAILHNYIDNNSDRKKWKIFTQVEAHLFDTTATSFSKGFAAKQSRIDFKLGNFWKRDEFEYYVEAKNLRSTDSKLKKRYIQTGIDNFLTGKYQDCEGFLVGYVLEGSIRECFEGINKLLIKYNRKAEVLFTNNFLSFDIFSSNHSSKSLNHIFLLYTS